MTQSKIERWHQTLKNRILLENYFLPGDLEAQIAAFVDDYNHRRYHESIDNLTPAVVQQPIFGRASYSRCSVVGSNSDAWPMSSARRTLPDSPRARCGGRRAEIRCDRYRNQPRVSAPIGSMNKVSASMTGPTVS